MKNKMAIGVCWILALLVLSNCAAFAAKLPQYDGIWFLGFNLKEVPVKDLAVRQAIDQALSKKRIAEKIVSSEVTPISPIPPGMLGYDPDLKPAVQDVAAAKALMKEAGYSMSDPRIKGLSLLHTDGLMTIEIAKQIQADLRYIGIKLDLVEIDAADEEKWAAELASGKHDIFLMGYKAGIDKLFTSEAEVSDVDSADLIEPLFKTGADVNFTGYSNAQVDKLLDQISGFALALKSERHAKLKQINQQLYQDKPVIVLFYIEKL
ncbi:MAG: hypothetical protein JW782_04525 [Candidatus Saganbacteria bacterium]|nr:hypothetical protein [Candidatus Saganbacteria bacterium]